MGRNVDDLALLMKVWLDPNIPKLDPVCIYKPFDHAEYTNNRPLRVGYYVDDGFVPASPACQRAVLTAVNALKGAGHTVEEFVPPMYGTHWHTWITPMGEESTK